MNKSGVVPVEYKVVVLPEQVKTESDGGIVFTQETIDADEMAQTDGVLVEVSDMAFNDWKCRIPKVGERVKFARYAGITEVGKDGLTYRIIKDQDIVAILGD